MSLRREVGYRYDDLLALMDEGEWYTVEEIASLRGQGEQWVAGRLHTANIDGAIEARNGAHLSYNPVQYRKRSER